MIQSETTKEAPILADPTTCVGCFRCALMCSYRFEKAFNPVYAKIRIVPADRSKMIGTPDISFDEACDGCGICIRACLYGVLVSNKSLGKLK